jgi:hypothetical protein
MAEIRVQIQGRSYRVGDDPAYADLPLPDWFPASMHAPWYESRERWGLSPEYGRVYRNPGEGLLVLGSCAQFGDGHLWLHVSASRRDHKMPTWEQLLQVKRVFVGDVRTAYQVMPPLHKHVNIHPGCAHLYCCLDLDQYLPDFTAGGETI